MKTLLYSLIAIFIIGIIYPSYGYRPHQKTTSIIVQSLDENISATSLNQAADIMKNRLRSYHIKRSDVIVLPGENKIKVSFKSKIDKSIIEKLLIQRGKLSFFEMYDSTSIAELINKDNRLNELLDMTGMSHLSPKIGCTQILKTVVVDDYLANMGLNDRCKFVWDEPQDRSETCLYALRVNGNEDGFLTWNDVESIRSAYDKISSSYSIELRFRKSAVETWANITRKNLYKPLAIVLDNKLIQAPIVRSEMEGGMCSINGSFRKSEVDFIVSICSDRILPVDFKIVE